MQKMVAKFSQKFTVHNCNSKASPGETHSGRHKTAFSDEAYFLLDGEVNTQNITVIGNEQKLLMLIVNNKTL